MHGQETKNMKNEMLIGEQKQLRPLLR